MCRLFLACLSLMSPLAHSKCDFITAEYIEQLANPDAVRSINIETDHRACKKIETTGFYPTILKCPELGPDIYLTE